MNLRLIGRFFVTRRGNVAMMFGLLLIPLLIGAGVAIDMLQYSLVKTRLSEAADAGLLAAARSKSLDPALTDKKAEEIARKYFDGNRDAGNVDILAFDFASVPGQDAYRLQIDARVKHSLLPVVGKMHSPLSIDSLAAVAPPRDLEVVLVLDNTYSMVGAKLTSLKSAATDLVNTIMDDTPSSVKIGLVPFSQYVNVGMSRRNASWMNVPNDYSDTNYQCWNTYPDRTESNCTERQETCERTRDGVTETWQCTKRDCDVDLGDAVEVCDDRTSNYTWRGCAGSREHPYNVRDELYDARPTPGLLNINCATELTPLTAVKATVTSAVNAMAVQGSQTYIPGGLVWGFRLLSSIEPFSEAITYTAMQDKGAVKALVLMTDGENTKSAQPPYHSKSGSTDADNLMDELCDEIKAVDIQIYTIAFEVSDTNTKTRLEDCATSTDNYFDASNAADLSSAFSSIATSLTELSLTR